MTKLGLPLLRPQRGPRCGRPPPAGCPGARLRPPPIREWPSVRPSAQARAFAPPAPLAPAAGPRRSTASSDQPRGRAGEQLLKRRLTSPAMRPKPPHALLAVFQSPASHPIPRPRKNNSALSTAPGQPHPASRPDLLRTLVIHVNQCHQRISVIIQRVPVVSAEQLGPCAGRPDQERRLTDRSHPPRIKALPAPRSCARNGPPLQGRCAPFPLPHWAAVPLGRTRGARLSSNYLNRVLVPLLCRKAGVPRENVRGAITGRRARATIATQPYNAKDPMSLFELQAWLGQLITAQPARFR